MDKLQFKVVQLSSVHKLKDTRIFYKICKSLIAAGYDLDLLIQHNRDEVVDGVNVKSLPVATSKLDRFFKTIPVLFKKCLNYPSGTVFHFHDSELIPIGFILKLFGHKVIYDVHEDVPSTIQDKEWIYSPLKRILSKTVAFIERIANSYFDATIVVTNAIQKRFIGNSILIQNFPIFINTVEISNIEKDIANPTVFYVGRISKLRCILEMVEAIHKVNEREKTEFLLGGEFDNQELKKQASSKVGWEYTNYLGSINREQLGIFAKKSLAGLVLFKPVPNHIEAQPNKLFEYMSYGLPVIGSDFPLWREIVVDNKCGLLVNPNSSKEIAQAINWILEHPEEAKKMGENGRRAVIEKYNWDHEEKKLLDVYQKLSKG